MNISTIIRNMDNTIEGKEILREKLVKGNEQECLIAEFLRINLDELKSIREDLKIVLEKEIEDSWRIQPERMGR